MRLESRDTHLFWSSGEVASSSISRALLGSWCSLHGVSGSLLSIWSLWTFIRHLRTFSLSFPQIFIIFLLTFYTRKLLAVGTCATVVLDTSRKSSAYDSLSVWTHVPWILCCRVACRLDSSTCRDSVRQVVALRLHPRTAAGKFGESLWHRREWRHPVSRIERGTLYCDRKKNKIESRLKRILIDFENVKILKNYKVFKIL